MNPAIPPLGKLALPPLPKSLASTAVPEKARASHACDQCRKAKTKCSGTLPCERCKSEQKDCFYGEGKREVEKRQYKKLNLSNSTLRTWNKRLIDKLSDVSQSPHITSQDAHDAQALVKAATAALREDGAYDMDDDGQAALLNDLLPKRRKSKDSDAGDEADADVGSTGSLDVIHEDTNRDEHARAAGFIGKSSAVAWVQRAKTAMHEDGPPKHRSHIEGRGPTIESCYYAEASDFPTIDESSVNPFSWPLHNVADGLIDAYFTTVHPVYPILREDSFRRRFRSTSRSHDLETGLSEDSQHFLCLLNIIFAIGAKHAHVTHAPYAGQDQDHLVYAARARRLGMDERSLHKDPDMKQTVCLALLTVYQLSTDQLNRAWTTVGLGIRHAMALGLHVQSQAPNLSDRDKELRVRLWWSLFNMERHLDEILGRPSCIAEHFVSTQLPLNIEQEQLQPDAVLFAKSPTSTSKSTHERETASANVGRLPAALSGRVDAPPRSFAFSFPLLRLTPTFSTCFILRTQLSIITHEILTGLFAPPLAQSQWSDIQTMMHALNVRLDDWRWNLPDCYNFSLSNQQDDVFKNHRDGLKLFYHASRMLLFRPCLCRFEGRIKDESQRSKSFNSKAAGECVKSARAIISTLPVVRNARSLYAISPWWNTLHYIIEAASVLMLELAYRAEHVPAQAEELVNDSKTAVLWLAEMADQSVSARKGWEIYTELLSEVAPRVGGDVSDMPTDAPVPPHWSGKRFGKSSSDTPYSGRDDTHTIYTASQGGSSTSAWVNDFSSTPRWPAPGLAHNEPPGASGEFMHHYGHMMQPFTNSGQLLGVFDEFGPWQSSIYGTAGFGQPSYFPTSSSSVLQNLAISTPDNLSMCESPNPMGDFSSSSRSDQALGALNYGSQQGGPHMPNYYSQPGQILHSSPQYQLPHGLPDSVAQALFEGAQRHGPVNPTDIPRNTYQHP